MIRTTYSLRDRVRGSLVGGAIGDALGYPVEFLSPYAEFIKQYGPHGITRFELGLSHTPVPIGQEKALLSDDTQMTLFTACGLLNAQHEGKDYLQKIKEAYIEWLDSQYRAQPRKQSHCWISQLPALRVERAPGMTCLTALSRLAQGLNVHNESKGCGGIMRIAPIPLFGAVHGLNIDFTDHLAADASDLTHNHPLGYMPSALVAHVIYRLALDATPTRESCKTYVLEGLDVACGLYAGSDRYANLLRSLTTRAVALAETEGKDFDIIENQLGGGWVAEETAAIAIYCMLKYFDNFEKAMVASVNHSGDSDSTGAVTGNLLGAAWGYDAIPEFYKTDLELHDVIVHIADDLYLGQTTPFRG